MISTMKNGAHRAFNGALKVAARVLPFPVPVLLTGPGSVKQLAENLKVRRLQHALVVTDRVLMDLKLPASLLASLEEHGIRYTVFDEVQPNPTIGNVEAGRKIYKQNGCDSIIGFGGGSPIDCAKAIGARLSNPYLSLRAMAGYFRVLLPIPPFYCVPTTAGTGSETTVAAVISDPSTHQKFVLNDIKMVPKIAVLDPELMVGLPPHITSTTGMDALTHAVEAYIGLNGSEVSDAHAKRATRLIFDNLELAYQDGSNLEARTNMAIGSFHGGAAFTRASVGYVHAIAHTLGGLYGVPHGLANAIILPLVLRFSRKEAEKKLADLAIAGGIGQAGESEEALSHRFIEHVEGMNKRMEIPTYVKELRADDIPLIAKRAVAEAFLDYPVPRIMTVPQCEELVRRLLPPS